MGRNNVWQKPPTIFIHIVVVKKCIIAMTRYDVRLALMAKFIYCIANPSITSQTLELSITWKMKSIYIIYVEPKKMLMEIILWKVESTNASVYAIILESKTCL